MRKIIRAAWAAAFAAVATSATLPAFADSTFTVTNSGRTFTIQRSGEGTNAAEVVHYRTVGLSAYAGQHFTATSGEITFAARQVTTNITVSERTPNASSYNYQTNSRAYRFEVLAQNGTRRAYVDRSRSVGTVITPSSAFAEQHLTITNGTITVTDDGYAQAHHDVPVSSYYSAAAPES